MPRSEHVTSGWAGSRTRGAANQQAPAAAPAAAPTVGVEVRMHGHGGLVPRGAAKTPEQIVNAKLVRDCWKETPRGVISRAQFEAFITEAGGRMVWLNLDGGGVNFELYLPAGKGKREIRVQGQYKHGQDHFAYNSRRAEGFGLSELFYVGDDGNFVAQYAPGSFSPVLLRVTHAAPDAAFSIRALVHDLGTLAAIDSKNPRDGNWVECTADGLVRFGGGSMGWAYLDRHDIVQKSVAVYRQRPRRSGGVASMAWRRERHNSPVDVHTGPSSTTRRKPPPRRSSTRATRARPLPSRTRSRRRCSSRSARPPSPRARARRS